MKVIKTMAAGTNGTNRLQRQWGEKLVCVRYRETQGRILTTIEIVIDDCKKLPQNSQHQGRTVRRNQSIVAVKVDYAESDLRADIKRLGGKWSKALKLWLVPYGIATKLAIRDRIQPGMAEKCPDIDTSLVFYNAQM